MKKKSNGKTAVIITGILFVLSLSALIILLALQLGGRGTEETVPQENAGAENPGETENQENAGTEEPGETEDQENAGTEEPGKTEDQENAGTGESGEAEEQEIPEGQEFQDRDAADTTAAENQKGMEQREKNGGGLEDDQELGGGHEVQESGQRQVTPERVTENGSAA